MSFSNSPIGEANGAPKPFSWTWGHFVAGKVREKGREGKGKEENERKNGRSDTPQNKLLAGHIVSAIIKANIQSFAR